MDQHRTSCLIRSIEGEQVTIESIHCSDSRLSTAVRGHNKAASQGDAEVEISLQPPLPEGALESSVVVSLSSSERHEVVIPVRAYVMREAERVLRRSIDR